MSHRQGLHSDDSPYPGEPLCYCDEKTPTTSTPTDLDNSIIGCCGGGLNRHEVCSHVKDYIQAEIVKARIETRIDAEMDILMDVQILLMALNKSKIEQREDAMDFVTSRLNKRKEDLVALKEGLKK